MFDTGIGGCGFFGARDADMALPTAASATMGLGTTAEATLLDSGIGGGGLFGARDADMALPTAASATMGLGTTAEATLLDPGIGGCGFFGARDASAALSSAAASTVSLAAISGFGAVAALPLGVEDATAATADTTGLPDNGVAGRCFVSVFDIWSSELGVFGRVVGRVIVAAGLAKGADELGVEVNGIGILSSLFKMRSKNAEIVGGGVVVFCAG